MLWLRWGPQFLIAVLALCAAEPVASCLAVAGSGDLS